MTENTRIIQKQKDSFIITIPKDIMIQKRWAKGYQLRFDVRNPFVILKDVGENGSNLIYTIGYEGRNLEDFIACILSNDIEQVIDVRQSPVSRRIEFSKEHLKRRLEEKGIVYTNIPEVGSPKNLRDELHENGEFEQFFKRYKSYLRSHISDFGRLMALAEKRPTVLMCLEADWRKCHRSVLGKEFEKHQFQVVHL